MSYPSCFHCSLPITEKNPPNSIVENQQKSFCCHGCKAVCEAIVSSGNVDYYHYRQTHSKRIDAKKSQEITKMLGIYDNPSIQKDFVRQDGDLKSAWIILEEIRCAACMWLNERTLRQLKGVISVHMDYSGQQAQVQWNDTDIKFSEILKAISQIGYIAHPFDPSQREALNVEQKQRSVKRLIFAALLGMILMQTAFAYYFFPPQEQADGLPLWVQVSRWSNLFISAALLAYPGQLFFINAWRDIKNKSVGMDVPIALGLSLAWLASLYSVLTQQGHVYFESIAMFVIFLLFARHVELNARIKANDMLDRFAKIVPKMAQLIQGDKRESIAAIDLKEGDIIQLNSGEVVPVDGYLYTSHSSFDESLLSGESTPVDHFLGDLIHSGAINIDQCIQLKVKNSEVNSTLSTIQQLTKNSMKHKPHYVETADRIASHFVITILMVALSTLLIWLWIDPSKALDNMIAVLIVTCPCALSLASPVALTMGAAALTRLKLVATQMAAIEKYAQIDCVVFDKTGTLTQGKAVLKQTLSPLGLSGSQALHIAASLEQFSSHPFAKALINANNADLLKVNDIQYFPSNGIQGRLDNVLWQLGKQAFSKVILSKKHQKIIDAWHLQGNSSLYLSNDEGCQGVFLLNDPLREGVVEFIKQLKDKSLIILSGDQSRSVSAIAKQLNIAHSLGGLNPESKLDWIKKKQAQGHKVMMFGDGINDAPTLAAADLSISFSQATDLAQSHSDLIILSKNYKKVMEAFKVMQKTRGIIRQNLMWAIAYNLCAVPAAAMGWVTPWMAAIGMSASSLLVVLNSMRLKRNV